jgi:hypothetical protein
VLELTEALKELADDLDARTVRQHVADRALAVAAQISIDREPPDSTFAAAVMSVRMVATDLMVVAGIEPPEAVEAVREGIQSHRVADPPTVRRPFSWGSWLSMPFARNR